jgi:hypothetical protein
MSCASHHFALADLKFSFWIAHPNMFCLWHAHYQRYLNYQVDYYTMVIGILGFCFIFLFVNEGATNYHCFYAFGLPVFKFAKCLGILFTIMFNIHKFRYYVDKMNSFAAMDRVIVTSVLCGCFEPCSQRVPRQPTNFVLILQLETMVQKWYGASMWAPPVHINDQLGLMRS